MNQDHPYHEIALNAAAATFKRHYENRGVKYALGEAMRVYDRRLQGIIDIDVSSNATASTTVIL